MFIYFVEMCCKRDCIKQSTEDCYPTRSVMHCIVVESYITWSYVVHGCSVRLSDRPTAEGECSAVFDDVIKGLQTQRNSTIRKEILKYKTSHYIKHTLFLHGLIHNNNNYVCYS